MSAWLAGKSIASCKFWSTVQRCWSRTLRKSLVSGTREPLLSGASTKTIFCQSARPLEQSVAQLSTCERQTLWSRDSYPNSWLDRGQRTCLICSHTHCFPKKAKTWGFLTLIRIACPRFIISTLLQATCNQHIENKANQMKRSARFLQNIWSATGITTMTSKSFDWAGRTAWLWEIVLQSLTKVGAMALRTIIMSRRTSIFLPPTYGWRSKTIIIAIASNEILITPLWKSSKKPGRTLWRTLPDCKRAEEPSAVTLPQAQHTGTDILRATTVLTCMNVFQSILFPANFLLQSKISNDHGHTDVNKQKFQFQILINQKHLKYYLTQ